MTAEVLREAAALMRERAGLVFSEARSLDPWKVTEAEGGNQSERRTLGTFGLIHDGRSEVAIVRGFSGERDPVSAHIASWHPAVALSVADWLDYTASYVPTGKRGWTDAMTHALAVATAYLGTTA